MGEGLQFRESGQSLRRHAVPNVEADLFDRFRNSRIFCGSFCSSSDGFRFCFGWFLDGRGRSVVSLDGDGVVPFGGEINFLRRGGFNLGRRDGRFIDYSKLGRFGSGFLGRGCGPWRCGFDRRFFRRGGCFGFFSRGLCRSFFDGEFGYFLFGQCCFRFWRFGNGCGRVEEDVLLFSRTAMEPVEERSS